MDGKDIDTLVLESKYPQLQYAIKGPVQVEWIDGFPVQRPKPIMLHFDRYLCLLSDEIRDQELTDEDKDYIARQLESAFKNPMFTDMWVHERARPGKPWPTYDENDAKEIPALALATGRVAEALTYERDGRADGPRESVVKKLEDLLAAADEPVQADDFVAV